MVRNHPTNTSPKIDKTSSFPKYTSVENKLYIVLLRFRNWLALPYITHVCSILNLKSHIRESSMKVRRTFCETECGLHCPNFSPLTKVGLSHPHHSSTTQENAIHIRRVSKPRTQRKAETHIADIRHTSKFKYSNTMENFAASGNMDV